MATRSLIGIERDNNKVEYVYCHWDGYPDGVGMALKSSYNREKLEELIALGSMSAIGDTLEECIFYTRDRKEDKNNNTSNIIDVKKYHSDKDIAWTEYRYLYTLDNKWTYYEVGSESVNLL